ncbi:hypothetical protein NUW58_g9965 [Xylaria curta]|uniref:Uncharacterized protein n=1 Tax=Xylaria curta TaxID=42375 RepID=A0ACC1MRE3_9PEZI|nr:hypothetical protein NUW58_g9965 [Xylaria curta]
MHEFLLDPNELPPPTIKDTALFKFPGWIYGLTVGRALGKTPSAPASEAGEGDQADDADSDVAQRTPSTSSADDFELLDKSVDDLQQPKTSGSQAQSGKAKKRNKKR